MRGRWSAGIVIVAAAAAIGAGGCGGSDKLTSKDRADFVRGCARAGGQATPAACGCIYDELLKRGYDTKEKYKALQKRLNAGNRPASFTDVARICLRA